MNRAPIQAILGFALKHTGCEMSEIADAAAEDLPRQRSQGVGVSGDQVCYSVVGLPQPYYIKLNAILEKLNGDGAKFLEEAIVQAIDKKYMELGNAETPRVC